VTPIADINIVRKELDSAVSLAELTKTVQSALEIQVDSIQAFTESTVVLACIKSDANRRKTYVKNRVSKIQSLLPSANSYHVPGETNRAHVDSTLIYDNMTCNVQFLRMPSKYADLSSMEAEQKKLKATRMQTAIQQYRVSEITKSSSVIKQLHFHAESAC